MEEGIRRRRRRRRNASFTLPVRSFPASHVLKRKKKEN
jgi:hypothetical protein